MASAAADESVHCSN